MVKRERKSIAKKLEIEAIYKLVNETRLLVEDIMQIFPNYSKNDIRMIATKMNHTGLTDTVEIDLEYRDRIIKRGSSIFPLGETYVKAIYIIANIGLFSTATIAKIFKVSIKTVNRIKLNHSDQYLKYVKDIDIEFYKNIFNISCKKLKNKVYLSNDQINKILAKVEDINNGKYTVVKLANDYNVDTSTIDNIFKHNNVVIKSKFNKKLTEADVLCIFDLANNSCWENKALCDKFNIGNSTLIDIKYARTHRTLLETNRMSKILELGL